MLGREFGCRVLIGVMWFEVSRGWIRNRCRCWFLRNRAVAAVSVRHFLVSRGRFRNWCFAGRHLVFHNPFCVGLWLLISASRVFGRRVRRASEVSRGWIRNCVLDVGLWIRLSSSDRCDVFEVSRGWVRNLFFCFWCLADAGSWIRLSSPDRRDVIWGV